MRERKRVNRHLIVINNGQWRTRKLKNDSNEDDNQNIIKNLDFVFGKTILSSFNERSNDRLIRLRDNKLPEKVTGKALAPIKIICKYGLGENLINNSGDIETVFNLIREYLRFQGIVLSP